MSKMDQLIAIISDNDKCLKNLRESVSEMGYEIYASLNPETSSLPNLEHVSMWLIYLSDEDRWADLIDELLERCDSPILFGSTDIPPAISTDLLRWKHHLHEKIIEHVGPPIEQNKVACSLTALDEDSSSNKPESTTSLPAVNEDHYTCANTCNDEVVRVWVLGASLGGPAAVKEFLDALPGDLPIAFILAQHIDKGFQKVLVQVLGRHSSFEINKETIGATIEYGKVYIAPVETVFEIENGRFIPKSIDWQGPYAPSIDQVMDITSRYYGENSGTILFSGMGNDGSISGPQQVERGGVVWAQEKSSCANSSMPDSARETGCVSNSATPNQLALQLAAKIRQEEKEKKQDQHKIQQFN